MITRTLDEALAPITDGCMLAVARESSGVAMAATRALVRRGVKRLHLITLPTSSLQADLLIGAGCIERLDTSGVSLGEFGPAPRFSSAIISGAVHVRDATCSFCGPCWPESGTVRQSGSVIPGRRRFRQVDRSEAGARAPSRQPDPHQQYRAIQRLERKRPYVRCYMSCKPRHNSADDKQACNIQ